MLAYIAYIYMDPMGYDPLYHYDPLRFSGLQEASAHRTISDQLQLSGVFLFSPSGMIGWLVLITLW